MRRLPLSIAPAVRFVAARLDPRIVTGDLAAYLSGSEPSVDTSTLELAQPVPLDERIHQLELLPGDRLLLMPEPTQPREFSSQTRTGEHHILIRSGDVEVPAPEKTTIVLGKPDEHRGQFPDVDLRMFLPPETLDFISRDCLRLQYSAGRWYAQRSGQTRIVIDDLELGIAPVLLNEAQRVRFYRATETDVYRRPLGSLDLLLGSRQSGRADMPLPDGNFLVPVALGNERGTYFLNASDHLTIRQVGAALLHHSGQTLENVTAYALRLLSPALPLEQVLRDGTFFYARNEGSLARYLLLLKDVNRPERRYQLAAGQGSERKLVGWHSSSQSVPVALDLDLSESLIPHLEPATASSPVKAYIHFSPVDQSWSIRAEEAGKTGVFVNHARVGAVPQRLTKGDVILFGLTPTQSYARLQVDLRSEHNQN